MHDSEDLSLEAAAALLKIRALRKLPETSGTLAATRRVILPLNVADTLAVALELDADDVEFEGGAR
jgi:hypothetical protein